MAYSPRLWLMAIGWLNKINQCRKLKLMWHKLEESVWALIQECIDLKISNAVMTSQERNKLRAQRSKRMQSLIHSFKKVSVSHAQLAHFSTLAKEKHMLFILNFSTLTFITDARTTMPFARLYSQMVCTQSERNLLKFLNTCLSKSLHK